jgi:ABC-type transport system involved in cytochrome c biogenesis permease subunit
MLSGISITCFAASYAVTLALEVSRLFFRLRVRWIVMILFAAAGLFAHTVYLSMLTRSELQGNGVTPMSHWYDWCLMAAWVLAAVYLICAARRPENTVGIFLLPLVLALVGAGYAVRRAPPFAREQALSYWGMFHGIMLLLGTVAAALGFAAGIMYLLQSYRLKHKLLPRPGFRLPTLEWLQKLNRRSFLLSTFLLALGLVAGLALNLIRQSSHRGTIAWTDPVVLSSGGLFLWLATATLFESLYKPAREGRKVACITLVSFVFLGLVLYLVLEGQHGISKTLDEDAKMGEVSWRMRPPDSTVGSGGRE